MLECIRIVQEGLIHILAPPLKNKRQADVTMIWVNSHKQYMMGQK